MLGRLLVLDRDVTSRFAMKARLLSANHRVDTANELTEAAPLLPQSQAVLLREDDPERLAWLVSRIRGRSSAAIVAVCGAGARAGAFLAGCEHVLDPLASDAVLRARLRSWLPHATADLPGFSEPGAGFDHADQIGLITDDATLSAEWRQAVKEALGKTLQIVSAQAGAASLDDHLAVVLIDAGLPGGGLQQLADLRARLSTAGRGAALALLQHIPAPEEEAQALDIGASEVLEAQLSEPHHRVEMMARLNWLLRRGIESERSHSDARLARRLASIDPLTGLLNRRCMAVEISAAMRSDNGFSLLMIDIDRFKAINDSHGHGAGDAVLRQVAAILGEVVGGDGKLGRHGGEEFVVLLPQGDPTLAVSLAERIRHAVATRRIRVSGLAGSAELSVSVSVGVGVTECCDCPGGAPDDVLEQADRALLAAKAAGRNIVMLARERRAA